MAAWFVFVPMLVIGLAYSVCSTYVLLSLWHRLLVWLSLAFDTKTLLFEILERKVETYHVSCEPLTIFCNDDTTCSTWIPCVLPTTGGIPGFSACSGQHAWHSCRAGCIVISENPQGLATHMVHLQFYKACGFYRVFSRGLVLDDLQPPTVASSRSAAVLGLVTKGFLRCPVRRYSIAPLGKRKLEQRFKTCKF